MRRWRSRGCPWASAISVVLIVDVLEDLAGDIAGREEARVAIYYTTQSETVVKKASLVGSLTLVESPDHRVILEVLAYPGEIDLDGNVDQSKHLCRTNAGDL